FCWNVDSGFANDTGHLRYLSFGQRTSFTKIAIISLVYPITSFATEYPKFNAEDLKQTYPLVKNMDGK
ncbi:MAG TPA: hypothetical protein VN958_10605, partial [Chitinophagaceae bacterium]|nr:hypothetical protein [Chitinophagaceae bacterium]